MQLPRNETLFIAEGRPITPVSVSQKFQTKANFWRRTC